MIDYRLIRSDRRTLSISVDREGALVVRAPARMSQTEIEAFLRSRRRWIEDKQRLMKQSAMPPLAPGARFPFWGGTLTIAFTDDKNAVCHNGVLWLPKGADAAACARKWRLQQAQALLLPRVAHWAQRTGLAPCGIAFGSAKTRWGSMNPQTRSLRLSAALVHLAPETADYVIVHELMHIRHPDHSPAFHASVRAILPDADARRAQLRRCAACIRLWE